MNQLEKKYRITYDSWEGYYVVHTQDGPVKFYKDENKLPYIDLEDSEEDAATLLVQMGWEETARSFVQMVRQNYEGFAKKEVLQAKEERQAMALIGNPSKNGFKGLVSNNMITNCPITITAITRVLCSLLSSPLSLLSSPV